MKNITVGYAFCGSFCTIKKSLEALKELAKNDIKIIPIMSQTVYSTDTRFGSAAFLREEVEDICKAKIIHDIAAAEPIGPKICLISQWCRPAREIQLPKPPSESPIHRSQWR